PACSSAFPILPAWSPCSELPSSQTRQRPFRHCNDSHRPGTRVLPEPSSGPGVLTRYGTGFALFCPWFPFPLFRRSAMRLHFLLGLTAVLLLAADAKDKPGKKDLKLFQGTWKIVSLEKDGKKQADDSLKNFRFVVKDNQYAIKQGDRTV